MFAPLLLIAAIGKISVASRIKPIALVHGVAPRFPMVHFPGRFRLPRVQMQVGTDEASIPEILKPEGPGQSWRAYNNDVAWDWRNRSQSLAEVSESDVQGSAKTKLLPVQRPGGPRVSLPRGAAAFDANPTHLSARPMGPLARPPSSWWRSARGRAGHHGRATVKAYLDNATQIDDLDILVAQVSRKNGTLASKFNTSQLEGRRARLIAALSDVDRALEAKAREGEPPARGVDRGSRTSAFEPSFGYLSRSAGVYTDAVSSDGTSAPSNAFDLAFRNFKRELPNFLETLDKNYSDEDQIDCSIDDCSVEAVELRAKLKSLSLNNEAVWARERRRPPVSAPLVLLVPFNILLWVLDTLFDGRPLARFWVLETVARMPYIAYVSALHLYESLGWWRRSAEMKRVHFAEEWNEFHHLLIMESLGGDQLWRDRFCAQHAAVVYYWLLIGLWFLSPSLAYNLSELIEAHAADTYSEFIDENREALAELPAPRIAKLYYTGPELFYFDEFQTSRERGSRRPPCETLLDVFTNIRDDEVEHADTMGNCQDSSVVGSAQRVEQIILASAFVGVAAYNLLTGDSTASTAEITATLPAMTAEDLAVAVQEGNLIKNLVSNIREIWKPLF